MTNKPLLKVDSVGIQFGGLKAVSDVNVELYPGRTNWSNWSKWCRKNNFL